MKKTVMVEKVIEFSFVEITFPITDGNESMSSDFPFRRGDTWLARITIDEGLIWGWPEGKSGEFDIEVRGSGSYKLHDEWYNLVSEIFEDYAPNGLIPGSCGNYGNYINLKINEFGVITNWPSDPDVSDFFPEMED